MKTLLVALLCLACAGALLPHSPAWADSGGPEVVEKIQFTGPYKLLLHVGPAEPFYTRAQVVTLHPKMGMMRIRGGAPGDVRHTNRHLVVHVYDRATGRVLTGQKVTLTVTTATGTVVLRVPVVEMLVAGAGPDSTHYGNNVMLKAGHYRVLVTVGASRTTFDVTLAATAATPV